eukprot:jgi/Psemu1/14701/gm1.14701_g
MQYGSLDSAATDHFLPTSYVSQNPQDTNVRVQVGCENGSTIGKMVAVAIDALNLPKLPLEARGYHKFEEVKFRGTQVTVMDASNTTVWEGLTSFPVQATQTKAIVKNFYTTWTGLSKQQVEYYLDKSVHTIKGHLSLMRKGIRSTNITKNLALDKYTKQSQTNKRSMTAGVVFTEELRTALLLGEHGTISCDMQGRLPHQIGERPRFHLSHGDAEDMVGEFRVCYDEMVKEHGTVARLVKLDNEIFSLAMKQFKKHHLDYHLVSPRDHYLNLVERVICTFKDHFVPILSGVDKDYPADQWDLLLLPQTGLTLNFIQPSRINGDISACNQVKGVIVHNRVHARVAWEEQGMEEFYIRPAMKHYQNYRCLLIMFLSDLKDKTTKPHTLEPAYLIHRSEVGAVLNIIQDILESPDPTVAVPRVPRTKNKKTSPIKRQNYYEDTLISQGPLRGFYRAKCLDGDEDDEYTIEELFAYRPEKTNPYQIQITAGGDRLSCEGKITTPTSSMKTMTKLHWNSVIITPRAKHCNGGISNMYLCSDLKDPKYIRLKLELIPPRIIDTYKLEPLIHNCYVYGKIKKTWYGLKQSGKIFHDYLVVHLALSGYRKAATRTEGLLLHDKRDISFTLTLDNFGGTMTDKMEVEASINGYVEQAMEKFEYDALPKYRQRIQLLGLEEIKFIQKVAGKLLFYGRAINNTKLHALNDIASAKDTQATLEATMFFLNYGTNHPNGSIVHWASETNDTMGGYQYLDNSERKMFNGLILVLTKTVKNVMAPAAGAEVTGQFIGTQEGLPERRCLIELDHRQPPDPLKTDNMTVQGILNRTIKQKISKGIDMRFYWLNDGAEQGQFKIF